MVLNVLTSKLESYRLGKVRVFMFLAFGRRSMPTSSARGSAKEAKAVIVIFLPPFKAR